MCVFVNSIQPGLLLACVACALLTVCVYVRFCSGECAEPESYIKGHGFSYWIPLQFDANGAVLPFAPFVDSFTLDIAATF